MISQANYYSVIPARVRYDKRLTYFDMILYGEISALTIKLGYCFATNVYLAGLFEKNETTISKSIAKLIVCRHLFSIIDKDAGNFRRLYLNFEDYEEAKYQDALPTPPIGVDANTPIGVDANTYPIKITKYENEIKSARKSSFNSLNLNPPPKDKELERIIESVYKKQKH